jgi:uncharacterized protein (TIGR03435 family)
MSMRVLWVTGISLVVGGNAVVPVLQTLERPAFEVTSVKPNKSGGPPGAQSLSSGDRVTMTNVPLRTVIQAAYGIDGSQLIGGSSWIGSERFDIIAIADARASVNQLQLMLRTLLAERFKLAVHTETRQLSVYALVVARGDGKLGPHLRRSEIDCAALLAAPANDRRSDPPELGATPPCVIVPWWPIAARAITMSQLADVVSSIVKRVVWDRTGLNGTFDLELQWTPDLPPRAPGGRPPDEPATLNGHIVDPNGPSIFTALQEQLGLKLDSQPGPVTVLIIDGVEKPAAD